MVRKLLNVKKKVSSRVFQSKKEETQKVMQVLNEETEDSKLGNFLATADKVWYEAIINHYRAFHCISNQLIPEEQYIKLYDDLAELFPLHAASLLNVACNQYFFEPSCFDKRKLNERKKVTLTHFFVLCRSIHLQKRRI